MPDAPTIPSPAEATAAGLNPAAAVIEKPVEKSAAENPVAEPPAKEAPKGLSDSISALADDAPPVKKEEAVVVAASDDAPKEGEKPAKFIDRLKSEKASLANQVKQLQEQIAKRGGEDSSERIKALEAKLAEHEQTINISAYERSEGFKREFDGPLAKAEKTARDLISSFSDTKGLFERAMALEGKERLEFLQEHLDAAAPAALDRLSRVDDARTARQEAIDGAGERAKAFHVEQNEREGKEIISAFDGMRESITKKLSVFRGENGPALVEQAKSLLTGEANPQDIIAAAYLAAAAPHYIADNRAKAAQIATLEARLAEHEKAAPKIGGRGGDNGTKPEFDPNNIPSPGQVIRQGLQEMRA